jgi:cyclopropane fatty-acyl-phospholipid synthase-like methyltransferase
MSEALSPGKIVRKLLGKRLFPAAGRLYRAFFVSLDKVVDSFPCFEKGAQLLDIGGGDGEVVNILLKKYPDVQLTLIDISGSIGGSIPPSLKDRIRMFPNTSVKDYRINGKIFRAPDYIILSDVVHHVPKDQRIEFLKSIKELIGHHGTKIVIKDIQPGHLRSILALLADRYITGDRSVEQISSENMERLMKEVFPNIDSSRTRLYNIDSPNYCLVFSWPHEEKMVNR